MKAFVRCQSLAAFLCVTFALTLAACGGSSTVAPTSSGDNASALGPDILQNGSPPPRWVVFQDNHLAFAADDQFVVDPVGKVWYTEDAVQRVAFTTMDHRQGAVCTGTCSGIQTSAPIGIAVGPDGKIWYADYESVVGTLTTLLQTATVVKYPTPGFHPFHIISGPGGDLWVTLQATDNIHDAIGRMSTSGVLTTFAVPTTKSGPWGLAVGPDGNVWFAEIRAHKVGKLDPNTGTIVEYPVSADFLPADIAWAKGSLYLTGSTTGTIGVMDTAGNFTERDSGLTQADDLGMGPDGNIWISGLEKTHSALAAFDGTSFHVHVYPNVLPNSPPAGGLVSGPDGNVWFAAEGTSGCRHGCRPEGFLLVYVRHELDVQPDALTFSGTGQSQSIVATETHFTRTFSAATENPSVATVTPGTNSSTFVVTSTGTGTTQIRVSDGRGNSFLVAVTVSSARR
jgi:streptogramin lyase